MLRNRIKVLLSGVLGNALEFYDFSLFGIFSTTLAMYFFPGDNQLIGTLKTLAIFSIGFLIRPLGSIFFGYIGDRYGRKRALSLSIFIMGLSTAGVGLLPTYNDVGLWAPILLIMMRLIQGFSLGGENNGAAVYTIESFSKTYSGFLGGLILTGGAIGTVSAMAFAAFVLQDHNPEWWWRLPFLSGILISMIALYVRYRLNESPVFKEKVANKKPKGLPVAEVIRNHPVQLLQAIGMGGVNGAFGYNLVVYLAIYLEQVLGFDVSLSKQYPAIGLSLFAFLAPTAGYLSDKIGRDVFMKGACLFVFFGALPLYYMLNQEYTAISMIVAALMMAGFNGPTNAYLNELFPAHIRYTGAALGYAIGIGTIGGTMPLISSYFLAETGNVYVPAFYLMLMSVVGFAAVHKYKKA